MDKPTNSLQCVSISNLIVKSANLKSANCLSVVMHHMSVTLEANSLANAAITENTSLSTFTILLDQNHEKTIFLKY